MKKILLLLLAVIPAINSFAQTVPNAGMETWRSGSSGTGPVISIHAPTEWYGFDSLIIADGEAFASLIGAGTDWHAQLFQENTIKNSGSSSAKLITLKQDTLGMFAGMLSSSAVSVDVAAVIAGADPMSALTFSGGIPVTLRIETVSAYVEYFPGKDSITHLFGGPDTATLSVQAISNVGGYDSVIGAGFIKIPPHSTFTQVTATLSYVDTFNTTDKMRIIFASSGGAAQSLDSSILYVDDISMTGIPQVSHVSVGNVANNNDVKVYPNPASDKLYINSRQNEMLSYTLVSVRGQVVANGTINGKTTIDISSLPNGLYFYTLSGSGGNTVQHGKISVNR